MVRNCTSQPGRNVRDCPYGEDHVDALLLAACQGELGRSTCVGGYGSNGTASERPNKQVEDAICSAPDAQLTAGAPHSRLSSSEVLPVLVCPIR